MQSTHEYIKHIFLFKPQLPIRVYWLSWNLSNWCIPVNQSIACLTDELDPGRLESHLVYDFFILSACTLTVVFEVPPYLGCLMTDKSNYSIYPASYFFQNFTHFIETGTLFQVTNTTKPFWWSFIIRAFYKFEFSQSYNDNLRYNTHHPLLKAHNLHNHSLASLLYTSSNLNSLVK